MRAPATHRATLADIRRRNGGINAEKRSERKIPIKKSRETIAVSLLNVA